MKTIWKYALEPETDLEVPIGGGFLQIMVQDNKPYIWALVDPTAKKETRSFRSYPTGGEVPDKPGRYTGSFQLQEVFGGNLVFHVFETTAFRQR